MADRNGRPLLDETTMSTKDPTLKKGIERRADHAAAFGVDASGSVHCYDRASNLLIVKDADGDVEYAKGLSPDRLTARDGWLNFVADRRGWIDEWLEEDVGLFEAQARLEAAKNGVPGDVEVLD